MLVRDIILLKIFFMNVWTAMFWIEWQKMCHVIVKRICKFLTRLNLNIDFDFTHHLSSLDNSFILLPSVVKCTRFSAIQIMATYDAAQILKRELRKRIRACLKALSSNQIKDETEYLTEQLLNHPLYQKAKSIGLYASLPTEMDTSKMLRDCLRTKKRVFLPRVTSKTDREMVMLEVTSMAEIETFDKGAYLIPEPPLDGRARAPHDVRLDLMVVPGVAFDSRGGRCGHGMGFYDMFLANYSAQFGPPMPSLIALVLSPQLVDEVPMNNNDWRIDDVIVAPANLQTFDGK